MQKHVTILSLTMALLLIGVGCQSTPAHLPAEEDLSLVGTSAYDIPTATQAPADAVVMEMMEKMDVSDDVGEVEMNSKYVEGVSFRYRGELSDVSGGQASGVALMDWKGGQYMLHARFEGLPATSNGDFYEGWVVRKEPFDFISTGRVVDVRGQLVNTYLSNEDYVGYDFYVLTLEPNDGDPAPAKHILEGTMPLVK